MVVGYLRGRLFTEDSMTIPQLILWVNGHTHRNIVLPIKTRPECLNGYCKYNNEDYEYTGFWEINTASHIDFPQQSRIVEIADNQDGTLSIFGTLIDHLSPPDVNHKGSKYSLTEIASISRELSYNDPFNDPRTRGGLPKDRNVELVINNPICRNW